jgi:hypothetical protein
MSDRIQREIEELLAKLDTLPPPRKPLLNRAREGIGRIFDRLAGGVRLPSVSAGHVLLAGLVLVVIGWVALGGTDIAKFVIIAGIALFVGAFFVSLRRQSAPPQEKYWRDRPIDLRRPSDQRSWWDRWRGRR